MDPPPDPGTVYTHLYTPKRLKLPCSRAPAIFPRLPFGYLSSQTPVLHKKHDFDSKFRRRETMHIYVHLLASSCIRLMDVSGDCKECENPAGMTVYNLHRLRPNFLSSHYDPLSGIANCLRSQILQCGLQTVVYPNNLSRTCTLRVTTDHWHDAQMRCPISCFILSDLNKHFTQRPWRQRYGLKYKNKVFYAKCRYSVQIARHVLHSYTHLHIPMEQPVQRRRRGQKN